MGTIKGRSKWPAGLPFAVMTRSKTGAFIIRIINILCEQTNNTAIKLQAKMLFDNQYLSKIKN